jgi:hypothetical protein
MYLTYQKSLPSFDQHMVQLEMDKPEDSKVYVEFQEGFIALATKYYEAMSAVSEVVLKEIPVVNDVTPAPVVVHAPAEPVVIVEEVPVVDVVRLDPVSVSTPVVDPVEPVDAPVTKKARKTSV